MTSSPRIVSPSTDTATAQEVKLQAFMDSQILIEEDEPGAVERMSEAVASFGVDGLPPCARCGKRIDDPRSAMVVKSSQASPSRLLHGECYGEELTQVVNVLRRGGRAALALGLDVL